MDLVKLLGRTGFFSFFNGVADFKIKPVLVLIPFFLEAIRLVEFELF